MSVAIFSFLVAWNDYLIALVFLRSDPVFTLPVGLQQFFQQNQVSWGPVMASAVLMLAPPTIVFAVFQRYFSIGGIGGIPSRDVSSCDLQYPPKRGESIMLGNLTGWHLLIVLAVVLLIFGAAKLPGLAKAVGQSARIFRSEVKTMRSEDGADNANEDVAETVASTVHGKG